MDIQWPAVLPALSAALVYVAAITLAEYALLQWTRKAKTEKDKMQVAFIGLALRIPAFACVFALLYYTFCPYLAFLGILSIFVYLIVSVPFSLKSSES